MKEPRILRPGRNVWRLAPASRASFVVDGDRFFRLFHDAALRARRSIHILGWDFHSGILLLEENGERFLRLRDFLGDLLERNPELEIRVLIWDAPLAYSMDREQFQKARLRWALGDRFHFHLDDTVPVGASHHQKVIVIDRSFAMCGGLDLTLGRWDTRKHSARDARRRTPRNDPYPPFHDVQLAMDGAAARALEELFGNRWASATGEKLAKPPPADSPTDPWPSELEPDLREIEIGIARTRPAHESLVEIREIERLWADAIAAARHLVYIENQYFTSRTLGEALGCKLQNPDGPEVIVVGRRRESSVMEEGIMGVLRDRLIRRLGQADLHGRLRLVHPHRPGLDEEHYENVHAKILVVDDRLVRVGSSNAANRSMGFDTECDVVIEAVEGRPDVNRAIARFRNDLLAEHLATTPQAVADAMDSEGSAIAAVEALNRPERGLRLIDTSEPELVERLVPDADLIDPPEPLDMESLFLRMLPRSPARRLTSLWRTGLPAALGLLLVGLFWWLTPLSGWLGGDELLDWSLWLRGHPAAPALLVGLYALGGLLLVPVTLLLVVTGLAFPPLEAFLWAMTGSLLSASVVYGAGRILMKDWIRALAGDRLDSLVHRLRERGLTAMTVVRVVPIAPFSVVSLVAGGLRLPFRDYLLATALGILPWTIGLTVLGMSLRALVRRPSVTNLFALVGLAALLGSAAWLLDRFVLRKGQARRGG